MNQPKRCVACKCVLDAPGPAFDPENDAEKHDPEFPDHCRACGAWRREEERYRQHLARGGEPYSAWIGSRRIG